MERPRVLAATAVALVVAVLAGRASGQQVKCPTPATQANFNLTQYLDKWHEIKRVSRSFERDGQCGTAEYTARDGGVDVLNTNYLPSFDREFSVNLRAVPDISATGVGKEAKFIVSWPEYPNYPESKYWVLGTDYKTYSVVYSCSEATAPALLPTVTLWVLSRTPESYTTETDKKVNDILTNSGLPTDGKTVAEYYDLEDVGQYCPPPKCAPCALAQENLDLDKLKGRWWELQHSPFSTGSSMASCGFVEVSSSADGIVLDVYAALTSGGLVTDNTTKLAGKWADASKKNGEFKATEGLSNDDSDRICIVGTDYDNWAVLGVCGAPDKDAPDLHIPGKAEASTKSGLWVLSRQRGLSSANQMAANKAVLSFGLPASALQNTPSTPCSAKALQSDPQSGAGHLAVGPIVILLAALTASL